MKRTTLVILSTALLSGFAASAAAVPADDSYDGKRAVAANPQISAPIVLRLAQDQDRDRLQDKDKHEDQVQDRLQDRLHDKDMDSTYDKDQDRDRIRDKDKHDDKAQDRDRDRDRIHQ